MMTQQEKIDFWIKTSDNDFESMEYMFAGKRYSWALFIGHLVIEKLLKALFIKVNSDKVDIPKTHNLVELAKKDNLTLTDEQESRLIVITHFNINARYRDYKDAFYKRCTKEYTTNQINILKEVRQWIKDMI
jgi:HEPN domain-containing protein